MNNSNQSRFRDIIAILALIIAIIALLVTAYIHCYKAPYLTYEKASYPLSGESLYVVIVKNEGHKSAYDVDIYIDTKGQIENAVGQMGLINREIEECLLFEESVLFNLKNPYFRVNLSRLPCGMVYRLVLTVSEQKNDKTLVYHITHRDGIAVERKQSCFTPFVIGLGLGAGSIGGIIFLYFRRINIKVDRNKKDEKRNSDEARGKDAKKE